MEASHLLRVAWRSLFRNRRRTAITVGSIGFGLAISLFFMSMTSGIHQKALATGVRSIAGHLMLEHPGYQEAPAPENAVGEVALLRQLASALPGVERTTAVVLAQAMASSGAGSAGVSLVGVEQALEKERSPIAEKLVEGTYLEAGQERGVLVGIGLAKRLKLAPGKKLVLSTANAQGELSSELFKVSGVFRTGVEEADAFLVQVPIQGARHLLGLKEDQASQVGVVLKLPEEQDRVAAALGPALRGKEVSVVPWQEVLPELSGWMEIDRRFSRVMEWVILGLVAFTILNTILMSVVERRREFAVLLALGTPPGAVRAQVLAESALLGLLGCALGLVVGCATSYLAQERGMDLSVFVQESTTNVGGVMLDLHVQNDLRWAQVVGLGGLVYLSTLLIGLYPMFQSTRVEVANLLRTR